MKNKVLIELIVPSIDEKYDIFIPINLKVGEILNLINKSLKDINYGLYKPDVVRKLYDCSNGETFNLNDLVINTDIRNGSKLVLV